MTANQNLWVKIAGRVTKNLSIRLIPRILHRCKVNLFTDLIAIFKSFTFCAAIRSSGQFPANFYTETYSDFGDFEKCLQISQKMDQPKYCLFSLIPDFVEINKRNFSQQLVKAVFPMEFLEKAEQSVTIGMCHLTNCNASDIYYLMNKGLFSKKRQFISNLISY